MGNVLGDGDNPSDGGVPGPVLVGLVGSAGTLNLAFALFPRIPMVVALTASCLAGIIGFGAMLMMSGSPRRVGFALTAGRGRLGYFCLTGAGIVYMILVGRILVGEGTGVDLALWLVGMGLVALFFAPNANIRFGMPGGAVRADLLIIGGLMALTLALHAHDLRDWYYAAIGDDLGFYKRVREILQRGIFDPFTVAGVYYNSPMLNSLYQALFSSIFGGGAFGWKFSSVASLALTIPPIYMLGRRFSGRSAGVIASVVTLGSHYIMAFTHTGYTHLDALPVTAWAALAFISGLGRRSSGLLFVAGLLAGLALYTALPARVVYVLFICWALLKIRSRAELLGLWPVAVGFAACAIPYLVENRLESVLVMGRDTISPYSIYSSEIGGSLSRVVGNLDNLAIWWLNPDHATHYTSGSLLDRVSGTMVIVGIGAALLQWRTPHKFLLLWLVVTMVPTALLAPYPQAPLTRMHSAILPMSLLSGVMVDSALRHMSAGRYYKVAAVCVIAMFVIGLNVFRFQYVTPQALGGYMPETLAVRAWESDVCERGDDTLFIGSEGHLMDLVVWSYVTDGPRPEVIEDYDDPRVLAAVSGCKVFFKPWQEGAREALAGLSGRTEIHENPRGLVRVLVVPPWTPGLRRGDSGYRPQ